MRKMCSLEENLYLEAVDISVGLSFKKLSQFWEEFHSS